MSPPGLAADSVNALLQANHRWQQQLLGALATNSTALADAERNGNHVPSLLYRRHRLVSDLRTAIAEAGRLLDSATEAPR
jgi:hypothetical protein